MCSCVRLLQSSLRSCSAPTTGEEGKKSRIHFSTCFLVNIGIFTLPSWARGSRCHKERKMLEYEQNISTNSTFIRLSTSVLQFCSRQMHSHRSVSVFFFYIVFGCCVFFTADPALLFLFPCVLFKSHSFCLKYQVFIWGWIRWIKSYLRRSGVFWGGTLKEGVVHILHSVIQFLQDFNFITVKS